jgi:hypothetical protein
VDKNEVEFYFAFDPGGENNRPAGYAMFAKRLDLAPGVV